MSKNKKFPTGKCIHCLKTFEKLTSDHVIPSSWYPNDIPKNMEKWQAPSCKKCNEEHGKNEKKLLYLLGSCVSSSEAKASGIHEKVLSGINPTNAKNEKDKRCRQGDKTKLIQELVRFNRLPNYGILPGFGHQSRILLSQYTTIKISPSNLIKFTTKIAKGMTFVIDNKYIDENDYDIETIFVQNSMEIQDIKYILNKYGDTFQHATSITVQRAVPHDDPNSAIFHVQIWGRLEFYTIVKPKVFSQHN